MKKILAAFFLVHLFVSTQAQDDEIRQPALGISFMLTDFQTAQRIRTTSLAQVFRDKKWAKIKETSPGLAITYFQGIRKHIDFAGTLAGTFVDYPFPNKPVTTSERLLLQADATLNFKMVSEKFWVQPYIIAGVSGHKWSSYWGATLPLGLGLKVNFFDEAHLFITSQYRVPVTSETSNYHFQHQIGIAGALGKKKEPKVIPPPPPPAPADTDGDGITDDKDKCPTVPGLVKYEGCPIPDTDKDGINDEEDKCPTVPGLAKYQGCPIPDTDKDGINDEEDKCPTVAGVARYQGCPVPDTDGDGVNDEEDKCPNLAGPRENQGCPVISEDMKKKVDVAANNILFVTGSAKLQSKSYKGLDEVVKIMNENPEMELQIDGHTDNVGSDELNQKLSDNRAASVRAYIISKGISESRITSAGHGETQPLADNKTAGGRTKNRRVEMKLSYYQ